MTILYQTERPGLLPIQYLLDFEIGRGRNNSAGETGKDKGRDRQTETEIDPGSQSQRQLIK